MNQLSWLIYLGELSGSVGNLCGIIVAAGSLGVLLGGIFVGAMTGMDADELAAIPKGIGGAFKAAIITVIVAAVIGTVVPSRETVYAIAASEMGERLLQSQTANKALQALNAWLDKQIAGAAKQ